MTKTLKMVFDLDGSKSFTLKILDPREDLTAADVRTVMQECIDKRVFLVKDACPLGIKNVYVNSNEDVELA